MEAYLFSVDPKRFILTERQGKIEDSAVLGSNSVCRWHSHLAVAYRLPRPTPAGKSARATKGFSSFQYPGTVDDMAATAT